MRVAGGRRGRRCSSRPSQLLCRSSSSYGRHSRHAPPRAPPPAARPAEHTSTRAGRGGGASMMVHNPDFVQSTRRLATDLKIYIMSFISYYFAYFTYCMKFLLYHLFSLYHLVCIMTNCIYYVHYCNYVHYFVYNNYCGRYFLYLVLRLDSDKVVCPFQYFEMQIWHPTSEKALKQ